MNGFVGEPLYITSLEEVIWGGILVAITMALHGFGMLVVLRLAGALKERYDRNPAFAMGMAVLILASWMILIVHLTEVFTWSWFFFWKDALAVPEGTSNRSLCYYFALMDYTTLGCNYNLKVAWRLLAGMIAMAGLLTFAWSTGVLLTLAQDFQEQEIRLLKQRREKRRRATVPSVPAPPTE